MFDIDRFAADCRAALAERGSDVIREVVRRAVSEPGDIIAALGEQTGASAGILIRASDLTILNVVWAPDNGACRTITITVPLSACMAGVGTIFWRRLPNMRTGGWR